MAMKKHFFYGFLFRIFFIKDFFFYYLELQILVKSIIQFL